MKIKVDTIILFVNNVAQVKLFYIDIFNFEIIEEIEAEWVLLNG